MGGMNLKIYDRAVKYIDKMLASRRDDWCEHTLYIRPGVYLLIRMDRVSLADTQTPKWCGWERGTPHDMWLRIVDASGKKKDEYFIRCAFNREYKKDLTRLLYKYT